MYIYIYICVCVCVCVCVYVYRVNPEPDVAVCFVCRAEAAAQSREREMTELHVANSRIGELAFAAATGDAAAAEAQRREVLASLAPNYATR